MGVVPPGYSVWMDGNTQLSREPRAIALAGPIPAPLRRPPPQHVLCRGRGRGKKRGLEKVEKKAEFGIPKL